MVVVVATPAQVVLVGPVAVALVGRVLRQLWQPMERQTLEAEVAPVLSLRMQVTEAAASQ